MTDARMDDWGPLARCWPHLPPSDRMRFGPHISVEASIVYGWEPVVGWVNIAGVLGCTVASAMGHAKRRYLPIRRCLSVVPGRGRPTVVAALCQLIRWAEHHAGWKRRNGW